ncbi:MAG: polymerase beta, Nucleotidyltransferase [Verrucomicrobiota bacterium]
MQSPRIPETAPPDRRPRGPLAPCVQQALHSLGERYAREGVRVFLFGSVARCWPEAPLGADFDLGYEPPPGTADPEALRRRLEDDLALLPSIRPVDLVDFSRAPASFRAVASQCRLDLADVLSPAAAR